MACLGIMISGDFNCARTDYQASMARIEEVIIIAAKDIISVANGVPTLRPSKKGTVIEAVNNSLKFNLEMVKNEGNRDSAKVTFELVVPRVSTLDTSTDPWGMDLDCVIAFKTASNVCWCAGALGTLGTLAISQSTTDHGLRKYTIGTPDWKYGSTFVNITNEVYEGLKIEKV